MPEEPSITISSPDPVVTPARTATVISLLLIVILGASLRIWLATDRPMWFDEMFSWHNATATSYHDLLTFASEEGNHPPLSFVLIKASLRVFGSKAPIFVRSTSLLAGVACIPLAFLFGRRLGSDALGLLAAGLAASDPLMFDQSAQARMFTLVLLGTLLAMYVAIRLYQSPNPSSLDGVGLGLALGVSFWNSQLILPCYAAVGVTSLAVVLWNRHRRPSPRMRQLIVALTIAAAIALLLAIYPARFMLGGRAGPSVEPSWTMSQTLTQIFRQLAGMIYVGQVGPLVYAVALAVVCIGALVSLRLRPEAGLLIITLGVAATLILIPLGRTMSFIGNRYLIPLCPVFWLGIASLPWLSRNRWWCRGVSALVIVWIGSQSCQSLLLIRDWGNESGFLVMPASRLVAEMSTKQEAILYCQRHYLVFGRYWENPARVLDAPQLYGDEGCCVPEAAWPGGPLPDAIWVGVIAGTGEPMLSRRRMTLRVAEWYGIRLNADALKIATPYDRASYVRVAKSGATVWSVGKDLRHPYRTDMRPLP